METNEDRFFKKVDIPHGGFGCWTWTGSKIRHGYGHFRVNGRLALAHRFMFELVNGVIGYGKHVCHVCDNPSCINPAHLFEGTPSENARDAFEKGRRSSWKGSEHPNAKLTEGDVLEIRKLLKTFRPSVIAEKYGITRTLVYQIRARKAWRHV